MSGTLYPATHCSAAEIQNACLVPRSSQHILNGTAIQSRQADLQLMSVGALLHRHVQANAAGLASATVSRDALLR